MSFTLLGLDPSCTTENGHYIALAIIAAEDILVMATEDELETLVPQAEWITLPINENVKVDQEVSYTRHGPTFAVKISITEHSLRPEVSAALQRIMGRRLVVAIQGDDEVWTMFGTNTLPLIPLPGANVEAARGDKNESTLQLSGSTTARPLYLPDWSPNIGYQPPQLIFSYQQQSPTSWFFTIAGSTNADGSPVTGSSSGITITYVIRRFGTLLYSGSILPGSNAATAGSWTVLAGSRNSTQFAAEWSSQCAGTGIAFTWNPSVMAGIFGDSYIDLSVTISSTAGSSATYTLQVPLS